MEKGYDLVDGKNFADNESVMVGDNFAGARNMDVKSCKSGKDDQRSMTTDG